MASFLVCATAPAAEPALLEIGDIRIRDPFIVTDRQKGQYVMVANMGNRRGGAKGWECYTSKDLLHWQKPLVRPVEPEYAGFPGGTTVVRARGTGGT